MEEENVFEQAIHNLKRIKQSSASETILEKSKLAIKGSVIGLVAGLMYGWYFKKNIYISAALGAVGGGMVNYFFIDYFKK